MHCVGGLADLRCLPAQPNECGTIRKNNRKRCATEHWDANWMSMKVRSQLAARAVSAIQSQNKQQVLRMSCQARGELRYNQTAHEKAHSKPVDLILNRASSRFKHWRVGVFTQFTITTHRSHRSLLQHSPKEREHGNCCGAHWRVVHE